MTDHDTNTQDTASNRPIAYVRAVKREDLPQPNEAPPGATLYALHDESGRPLALFNDRDLAMIAARTHDFTPMSVH